MPRGSRRAAWMPGEDLMIRPSLLNSASLWATTLNDLVELYNCPWTGAVTTRTCLLAGYKHDPSIHQHCFVDTKDPGQKLNLPKSDSKTQANGHTPPAEAITSLNTLGYSPICLDQYLTWAISVFSRGSASYRKPFIFSVTGSPDDTLDCFRTIAGRRRDHPDCPPPFHLEINLSCPDIADKPPPAYSRSYLAEYLDRAAEAKRLEPGLHEYCEDWGREYLLRGRQYKASPIYIGLKLPPYTYATQFSEFIAALRDSATIKPLEKCPINFITTTNTLGSSLLLTQGGNDYHPAIASASGTGIGGLAGAALHPLALGNVATLRRMLDEHDELCHIEIIGVGGVSDRAGYERMKSAGAVAVGVATALGAEGVGIFEKIRTGKTGVKVREEENVNNGMRDEGEGGVKDKEEVRVEDEPRDEGKGEVQVMEGVRMDTEMRGEGKEEVGDKSKEGVRVKEDVSVGDRTRDASKEEMWDKGKEEMRDAGKEGVRVEENVRVGDKTREAGKEEIWDKGKEAMREKGKKEVRDEAEMRHEGKEEVRHEGNEEVKDKEGERVGDEMRNEETMMRKRKYDLLI